MINTNVTRCCLKGQSVKILPVPLIPVMEYTRMTESSLILLSDTLAIGIGPDAATAAHPYDWVVVFDVLRAGATLCQLMATPVAEPLYITASVEAAFRGRTILPGARLVGERNARKIEGFDFGNSPAEIERHRDALIDQTILFTSTAGARALTAGPPGRTLVGSLTNLAFLRDFLGQEIRQEKKVALIAASGDWSGSAFMHEDLIAVLWLISWWNPAALSSWPDFPPLADALDELKHTWDWFRILARTHHGRELIRMGYGQDIAWIGNHFNQHSFTGCVKAPDLPDHPSLYPLYRIPPRT